MTDDAKFILVGRFAPFFLTGHSSKTLGQTKVSPKIACVMVKKCQMHVKNGKLSLLLEMAPAYSPMRHNMERIELIQFFPFFC